MATVELRRFEARKILKLDERMESFSPIKHDARLLLGWRIKADSLIEDEQKDNIGIPEIV